MSSYTIGKKQAVLDLLQLAMRLTKDGDIYDVINVAYEWILENKK